jgi:hypothetical protein
MPRWDSRVLEPKVLCETQRQVGIDPVGDKQGDARDGHQLVKPTQNGSRSIGVVVRLLHLVGHPDPDDVAYQESVGLHGVGMHSCDGCCRPKPSSASC